MKSNAFRCFPDVAFEMMLESGLNVRGYGDGPDAGVRFRPTDGLEPVDANDRSPDVDRSSLQVDVVAAQFEHLPEAEGAPRRQQDGGFQCSWVSSTRAASSLSEAGRISRRRRVTPAPRIAQGFGPAREPSSIACSNSDRSSA